MAIQELTPDLHHKSEIIHSFVKVIRKTSPALAAVIGKYLLPVDSERSQQNQAKFQIETFAELLELWTAGIAPELLIQVLPYYLGILEHHLTEKGTDDFLFFAEDGSIPLEKNIVHYNTIASELAAGTISLQQAISRAHDDVATPELANAKTDLTELFGKLSENPSMKKKIAMLWLDIRHPSHIVKKKERMSLRGALNNPNTFIMLANLYEIANAREDILELNQKTNGRLQQITDFTLEMLVARYTGGNELLSNVHVPVESAMEIGEKTVLIGYTYGQGLLAHASADPEFLAAIENQQQEIINAMTDAARLIREMNDASPTALKVWGENRESTLEQLNILRQKVGLELRPKEFYIELKKRAETDPTLQRYVDCYARQVVDAEQGEYNIGLFAATDTAEPNTWESFIHNMDFMAPDYAQTSQRLWLRFNQIDKRAADFIGKMIGYHRGLYSFAKGDFDDPRDIEELTMECALEWPSGFSESKSEQVTVFKKLLQAAKDKGETKKESLLSGLIQTLEGKE